MYSSFSQHLFTFVGIIVLRKGEWFWKVFNGFTKKEQKGRWSIKIIAAYWTVQNYLYVRIKCGSSHATRLVAFRRFYSMIFTSHCTFANYRFLPVIVNECSNTQSADVFLLCFYSFMRVIFENTTATFGGRWGGNTRHKSRFIGFYVYEEFVITFYRKRSVYIIIATSCNRSPAYKLRLRTVAHTRGRFSALDGCPPPSPYLFETECSSHAWKPRAYSTPSRHITWRMLCAHYDPVKRTYTGGGGGER